MPLLRFPDIEQTTPRVRIILIADPLGGCAIDEHLVEYLKIDESKEAVI